MKKLLAIAFIIGILASAYNVTHINYQIERRTLAQMTDARAMRHWKWEHGVLGIPEQYRPFINFITHKLSPKYYLQMRDGNVLMTNYSPYSVGVITSVIVTAMFILVALYYRKLGFNENRILTGLFIFFLVYVAGVSNETFRENTYLEICFFLSASLLLLYKKSWIPILLFMPIGALNRETCFFIPWIMASLIYFQKRPAKEYFKPAVLLFIWASIFFGLRFYYPEQTVHNFAANGAYMTWDWMHSFLRDNLTNINSLALWLVFPASAIYLFVTKKKYLHPYLLQGIALPILALTALGFWGGTINEICTWEVAITTFLIPMFLTERELIKK